MQWVCHLSWVEMYYSLSFEYIVFLSDIQQSVQSTISTSTTAISIVSSPSFQLHHSTLPGNVK